MLYRVSELLAPMIKEKIASEIIDEVLNTDEFIKMQEVVDELGMQDEDAEFE